MENTADYIIETIAPIFNKKGYVGTRLSDLTEATKLTKGALYCNFRNKEALAIKSFHYSIKKVLYPLFVLLSKQTTSINKLKVLTDFYRRFYDWANESGGCPILNIGVDAKYNSPALYKAVKEETSKLINGLTRIIQSGIDHGEFKQDISAEKYARNFYSMIEGAVFMAMLYEDQNYLIDKMDLIDEIVISRMKRV